jgi:TonB-dependent starch-binding outer membrane protein SusC
MKQICTRLSMLATLALSVSAGSAFAQQDVRRAGSSESAAQQGTRTVTGKVLDEAGQPVAGATITATEVGTGRLLVGTYSQADGSYTVLVPSNSAVRVRVSYIGYAERTVTVDANQGSADFTMVESSSTLEEVQITGFGTISGRDNTGTIRQVKGSEIRSLPNASFAAGFQGRLAGVQITSQSGIPGAAVRIRSRGQSTIGSGGQPLIVVDGVIINNEDLSDRSFNYYNQNNQTATNTDPLSSINPDDIESYDLQQDAFATSKYGSRAANGVLVITTKKGKGGKTSIDINSNTGWSEPTRELPLLTGPEWLALRSELYSNQNAGAPIPSNFNLGFNGLVTPASVTNSAGQVNNTDWYDGIFKKGLIQNTSVNISSGTEKQQVYAGISYLKNGGFFKGAGYEKIGGRITYTAQATNRLNLELRIGITQEKLDQVPISYNGGLGDIMRGSALNIVPIYVNNDPAQGYFGSQAADPRTVGANPVAKLENDYTVTKWRILSSIKADYKIMDGLVLSAQYGFDHLSGRDFNNLSSRINYRRQQQIVSGALSETGPFIASGSFTDRRYEVFSWNFRPTLNWEKAFDENNKLTSYIGFEVNEQRGTQFLTVFNNNNAGYFDPSFYGVAAGLNPFLTGSPIGNPTLGGTNGGVDNRRAFVSYFASGDYKWRDRYTFGVSVRVDGSSLFGANKRYGTFGAIGAGWELTKDPIFDFLPDWVSFLRIKSSYGITGNADLQPFNWSNTFGGTTGYLGVPGQNTQRLPNPDLSWEDVRQFNLGLNGELFEGRISFQIDGYYNRSTNLLLARKTQSSTGFFFQLGNQPNIILRNRGIDVNLTATILKAPSRSDIGLRAGVRAGFLDIKVLSTDGAPPDGFQQGPGDARIVEGYAPGVAYLVQHAFVDPATGDEYFYDANGVAVRGPIDNTLIQTARKASGNPFPWLQGGFDHTLTWNGLELTALWTYSVGNTIYEDGGKYQIGDIPGGNQRREVLNRWTTPGQVTNVPRLGFITDFNANNSTRFLYDGDFLRLREVTLAYNFDATGFISKLGFTKLRIYATGQNLLVFTKFPGWDPEVSRYANDGDPNQRNQDGNVSFAAPYLAVPQARSYVFGVNVTF